MSEVRVSPALSRLSHKVIQASGHRRERRRSLCLKLAKKCLKDDLLGTLVGVRLNHPIISPIYLLDCHIKSSVKCFLLLFVVNIQINCTNVLAAGQKTRQKCYLKSNLCQLTNIKYEMEDELQGTIKLLYTQNTARYTQYYRTQGLFKLDKEKLKRYS